jgi:hypothetical protein
VNRGEETEWLPLQHLETTDDYGNTIDWTGRRVLMGAKYAMASGGLFLPVQGSRGPIGGWVQAVVAGTSRKWPQWQQNFVAKVTQVSPLQVTPVKTASGFVNDADLGALNVVGPSGYTPTLNDVGVIYQCSDLGTIQLVFIPSSSGAGGGGCVGFFPTHGNVTLDGTDLTFAWVSTGQRLLQWNNPNPSDYRIYGTLLSDTFTIPAGANLYGTNRNLIICCNKLVGAGNIDFSGTDGGAATPPFGGPTSGPGALSNPGGAGNNAILSSGGPPDNTRSLADALAGGKHYGLGGAGGASGGGTTGGNATTGQGGPLWRYCLLPHAEMFDTSFTAYAGAGCGGASGGGDAGTRRGGGPGGQGGGWLILVAKDMSGFTGAIKSRGGAGGVGAVGGNCGGGGGGGGGVITIFSKAAWSGTPDVIGGAGGTPSGSGVAGSPGGAGLFLSFIC